MNKPAETTHLSPPGAPEQTRDTAMAPAGGQLVVGADAFGGLSAAWSAVCSLWLRRWWLVVIGMAICFCWDRAVYLRISVGADLADPTAQELRKSALESGTFYSLVKACGEPWMAMLITVALVLIDWAHFASRGKLTAGRVARRATMVALVPLLSAGLAEVLKGLTRRQRPIIALDETGSGGWYHFRWWWDRPFQWDGLGFASSHAAAAFGLAFVLCVIWPRLGLVWILMGVLVGYTRILSGAHFLSDVFGGLVVAYTVFVLIYELDRWNNNGAGIQRHLKSAGPLPLPVPTSPGSPRGVAGTGQ